MTKMRIGIWLMLVAVTSVLAGLGCDDDGDDGAAGDDDADTDTDTGEEEEDEECIAPFEWGDSFEQYETIANWSFTGYIDADGDGVVEEEVEFDMNTIHCSGLNSVVLVVGDTL